MSESAERQPASNPSSFRKTTAMRTHADHGQFGTPWYASPEVTARVHQPAKPAQVQAKLKVGSAFDPAEAEADNAAREVVSKSNGAGAGLGVGKGVVQTKPLVSRISRQVQRVEEDKADAKLQRQEEEESTQMKVMRAEDEEASPKLMRAEEDEASPKLMRAEEEEASPKLMRAEEDEASPKLMREADEEASPKLMRAEEEEASPKLQRQEEEAQAKCADCEEKASREEEEEAMTKQLPTAQAPSPSPQTPDAAPINHLEGFTASESTHDLLKSRKGAGEPLPEPLKNEMEAGFGADFSNVKVHRDSASTTLNKDLKAKAFTHGEDVFFGQGQFDAGSNQGKELIAHELTHTIQQGAVGEKKAENKPAESPVEEMASTLTSGDAVSKPESKQVDPSGKQSGQVQPVDKELPVTELDPAELEQQSAQSEGADAAAVVDQAGEGDAEGEVVAGVAEGEIPDVETESEIDMPSVEKQRVAGQISDFKGSRGEVEAKGGEVFKFMATETENVCGDAAEATAELAANESEHPTPVDEVA
ncbi:MAG: DUF4157 domain-containing protein, partial [Bacteroidia bacterium]|nr:DUF4157 domain-containing protein [Bacteroidia bacterium]